MDGNYQFLQNKQGGLMYYKKHITVKDKTPSSKYPLNV